MKRTLFLFASLAFLSCKQDKPEPAGEHPYFIFDKAVYYHKDVTAEHVDSLYNNPEISRMDKGLLQIITGNVPVNPLDTMFVKNMDILNFEKKEIDVSKNDALSKIFSQKSADDSSKETANCKPIYKDVIVFRQKGKVVGVAKISFDCKKQQMVGIRYNPENFGNAGEYEQLESLLKI